EIFLDLNDNFIRFPFLPQELIQCDILNLDTATISSPTDSSAFISAIDTNITINVNLDSKIINCNREDLFQGRIESFYRRRLASMVLDDQFNELQRGYNSQQYILDSFNLTNPLDYDKPLSLKTIYSRKNSIIKVDNHYLLYLPELTNVSRGVRPLYERNRARKVVIKITIPDNLQIIEPETFNIEMPHFESKFSFNSVINKQTITIEAHYLSTLNNRKTNQEFFEYEQQINRILEKPLIFKIIDL
ncbi:MAG: hypothetical protein ACRC37_02005, partial [Lentisphaeria bacterium]